MIAYLDSSVLLRVVLGQRDRLEDWSRIREGVASALVEVECLRTLDRLKLSAGLSDRDLAARREAVYRLLDEVSVVDAGSRDPVPRVATVSHAARHARRHPPRHRARLAGERTPRPGHGDARRRAGDRRAGHGIRRAGRRLTGAPPRPGGSSPKGRSCLPSATPNLESPRIQAPAGVKHVASGSVDG